MKHILPALLFILSGALTISTSAASPVAIVIHAGAGGKGIKMAPEKEKEYHKTLTKALRAGHAILEKKGSAIEAVQAAIVVMENSTLFNAGKGAVFTSAGENELDASIMDGKSLQAGAVGGVTVIKNPIRAAHARLSLRGRHGTRRRRAVRWARARRDGERGRGRGSLQQQVLKKLAPPGWGPRSFF